MRTTKMNTWKQSDIFKRYEQNPVLTPDDIPYDSTLVLNPGVLKKSGKYYMVFRNDWGDFHEMTGPRGSQLGLATSDDGIKWDVSSDVFFNMSGTEMDYKCCSDPRLMDVEGQIYMTFALYSKWGLHGAVATVSDDFSKVEVLGMSAPDNRNMVMFPERINGKLARLERPMPVYSIDHSDEEFSIWYSDSPDGIYWGNSQPVLGAFDVPYANSKIGPAAPPIKTDRGWLTLFHSVWKDSQNKLIGWEPYGWYKKYVVGAMLLDIDQPWKVIAMSPEPVMVPQEQYPYEIDGFRGSVIFPCGIVEEDERKVRIYYGASDTVVAMATCEIDKLLDACQPLSKSAANTCVMAEG